MDEEQSTFATKRQKMGDKKYDELTTNSLYDINKLFEKYFIISNAEKDSYTLPNPESMFKKPSWSHNDLQELKSGLNQVKSRLNTFKQDEWQHHTHQMNKAGNVIQDVKKHAQPELLTQAWIKFYEITITFPLVPLNEICHKKLNCFKSVHLCEAPGAFVTALNHWLVENTRNLEWNWLATSLNPYCEDNAYDCMITDDRFIKHTLQHWCFGEDNTGDIMNVKNLEDLIKKVSSFDVDKQVLLVTADGSINCTNMPGEQESVVAQLHLCETVACMHILQKDGNYLLKLFTLFEHQSVCLMYLLACTFHEVIVIKPATSKGGNSEIYVFCRKFKGKDHVAAHLDILRQHYGKVQPKNAMFSQDDIPPSFVQKIVECSAFFKHHQCQIIEDNIRTYRAKNAHKYCAKDDVILNNIQRMVSSQYITNCRLNSPLNNACMIVGRFKIKPVPRDKITFKDLNIDSYNERCKRHNLKESLLLLREWTQLFNLPTEIDYIMHLQILSEELLKIETGKLFTKVRSSRFSDAICLHILNTFDTLVREQEIDTTICFPSAKITREQQEDPNQEILSFQFSSDIDNYKTIIEVCNRVKGLRTGQTLTLANYSLLPHLNVGLLYLLGNCFDRNVRIIGDNEGCRIRLENYQPNEKVLNYLDKILTVSDSEQKKHRMVWSIISVIGLEECDVFPTIKEINDWMTKWYVDHQYSYVMSKI